jgi:Fe-S-cluster-containing hydrogenase component 2
MIRQIIEIDEEKCDGCELCIPGCPEGAIQMVDGKAKMVNDVYCDGLGACLGHCPQGAITVIEREADEYNETEVMENIMQQGHDAVQAHLAHLSEHGEEELLREAKEVLLKAGKKPVGLEMAAPKPSGCPSSQSMAFNKPTNVAQSTEDIPSSLTHWPIQLHLLSPMAPHYAGSDLVLAADCVAFSMGDFHQKYLQGKTLAIACPKLDSSQNIYLEKLKHMIDDAKINTLTVLIMQVPCCSGLLQMAQQALAESSRKIPIKAAVVGIQGDILKEDWL